MRLKSEENLKYVFDLKGSTVDRKVKGITKTSTTLKDVNFLMVQSANGPGPGSVSAKVLDRPDRDDSSWEADKVGGERT